MRNVMLWASERFPLRNMVFFGLLYATGVFASRAMTRTGVITVGWQDAGGLLAVVAFFLTLRVLDEHKDYEIDCLTHPDRVLQRGLISLASLRVVGVAALVVQMAFVLLSDRGIGVLSRGWLLVAVWTTLMAVEFFAADWLRPRLLLYAALHLAVMPLLLWWIALVGAEGVPLPPAVWLLLALGYSTAAAFEMARKLRAPADERPGIDSYSRTLGTRMAARVLTVDILVTVVLSALLVWNLFGAATAAVVILFSVGGALGGITTLARFGALPSTTLATKAERGTAVALLGTYVTLIATVVIERGDTMGLTLLPRTDAALLLGPRDAHNAGVRRVGGKAMGLARLQAIGAHVPPWFVIPADAFAAHVARVATGGSIQKQFALLGETGMDELTARKACDSVSRVLRAAIESAPVVEALGEALAARLDDIAPGPFAVRSSMTDEDSAKYSFAGQFDTFLVLSGVDDVLDAVVRCWGSAFTARALAYRRHMGIPLTTAGMAVVVQQMAAADVSGVLFTTDPTVATTDGALVSACWGLGEGIVSGACDADTYRWSERRGEIAVSIGRKASQIVRRADGRGTGESDVPDDLREVRCLTKAELTAIGREGMRIADALGGPQDIEWSLADGQLFILQARPITTRRAINPAQGAPERVVWDNSNIQESYCGVTTPLTFSFARGAYASVYEQTMRALGLPDRVIDSHRPLLRNLLGLVGGRIYYDIRNWYRGLLLLPPSDATRTTWSG